eukprot:656945-Rhodomonas_salina.2
MSGASGIAGGPSGCRLRADARSGEINPLLGIWLLDVSTRLCALHSIICRPDGARAPRATPPHAYVRYCV